MAATGYTPIQLYYSSTATNVPSAGNLLSGELAINIADGKLYYKDNLGAVQLLASNASTTNVNTISFGSTGLTPNSATSGAVTVAGTLGSGYGGTGFSTYATGDLIYASATNTLSKLAAGTNGYVLTLTGGVPVWAASTGGVTSFQTSLSGLTPSTSTTGAITLAGTLGVSSGGTGQTTYTDGQLLIGNSTGNTLTKATLTAGAGISITNGSGAITITNTSSGAAITNDTSTATAVYPLFAASTTGSLSTAYTSNANLLYTPSTGAFQAKELEASNGLVVNNATINSNYSIPSGYNASSVGPVTVIGAITVPSGSRWLVLQEK